MKASYSSAMRSGKNSSTGRARSAGYSPSFKPLTPQAIHSLPVQNVSRRPMVTRLPNALAYHPLTGSRPPSPPFPPLIDHRMPSPAPLRSYIRHSFADLVEQSRNMTDEQRLSQREVLEYQMRALTAGEKAAQADRRGGVSDERGLKRRRY